MASEGNAPELPAAARAGDDSSGPSPVPATSQTPAARRVAERAQLRRIVRAARDSDLAAVDDAVLRLSRSRRWLAPLALAVGAIAMLFEGLNCCSSIGG